MQLFLELMEIYLKYFRLEYSSITISVVNANKRDRN